MQCLKVINILFVGALYSKSAVVFIIFYPLAKNSFDDKRDVLGLGYGLKFERGYPAGQVVDFSRKKAVGACLCHVQRFRRARKGHSVFQKNGRFMDMSQGNIRKRECGQGVFIKGLMFGVAAVKQKNFYALAVGDGKTGGFVLGNFRRVIAVAVNLGIQVLKINGIQLFIHEKGHVGTPGKAKKGGAFTDSVVVSRNDDYP